MIRYSLTPDSILPVACSLEGNDIEAQGVTALTAILNETKITSLKCAATSNRFPSVRSIMSASVDTRLLPPIPCSLGYNNIGVEGASALAAILKGTKITNLK